MSAAADNRHNVILKITKRVVGLTCILTLYRFLQVLAFPFIFLYFSWRYLKDSDYRPHFWERLGWLPEHFCDSKPNSIWIHAVSVGEVASAVPLLRQIRERSPETPLYLSTATTAGRKIAETQAAALVEGIFYAPIDFAFAVRRTLRMIRPSLVVILETEIWPNLYSQTKIAGSALVLLNGRISDRAWPKYRSWGLLFSPIVRLLDLLFVQGPTDLQRFQLLGAGEDSVTIESNLKYDAAAQPPPPLALPTFGAEQVWIAASTVGPNERGSLEPHQVIEEQVVIEAFRKLGSNRKKFLLILAPRQPSRFDEVAELLRQSGLPMVRRSEMAAGPTHYLKLPGILLLDTLGELARIYHLADVVFVGGSIAPRGGHNILEPAFAGVPIVVGPHMQNFESISREFLAATAIVQIPDAASLAPAIERLLDYPEDAQAFGRRARAKAEGGVGASERLAEKLLQLQATTHYRPPRPWALRVLLGALALVWERGGEAKRRRSSGIAGKRPKLGAPVVSIGGITVGGSGKTPFTNYLATRLRRHGFRPAILTRGYRRRSPSKSLVIAPGTTIPTSFTGDEAQVYLRTGLAAVGIGTDRYETGRVLLENYPEVDIVLLDDGFQHAKMARDLDVVMIDGLDPFGEGQLVPAGRLREPLSALARADLFVITRVQSPDHLEGIRKRLDDLNPRAPIFESRVQVLGWRRVRTGERMQISAGRRVAAFCGLGNPKNFFQLLEQMGLEVVKRTVFGDHHFYQPMELRLLAQDAMRYGAELLVTTEKDRVNFPEHTHETLKSIETAWLEIELSLTEEAAFFAAMEDRLRR